MRFTLLGVDEDSLALARAARAEGHTLSWIDPDAEPKWTDELRKSGIPPAAEQSWEQLLETEGAPVLVGRGCNVDDAARIEQLKSLARSGVAMLVIHPVCDSLLATLEIDMLALESNAVLQIYPAGGILPAARLFHEAAAAIGPLEQVVCTRFLADRTPASVTRAFARDVCLLEHGIGRFGHITAIGAEPEAAHFQNLTVQLAGKHGIPVQWRVERTESRPDRNQGSAPSAPREVAMDETLEVKFVGAGGTARLGPVGTGEPPKLQIQKDGSLDAVEGIPPDAAARQAIRTFSAQMGEGNGAVSEGPPATADWEAATRAMELSDSIEISLRRKRTIELHYQRLTEQTTFRGAMAMAGCGLLLLLPVLVALAGVVGDLLGFEKMLGEQMGVALIRFWYVPVLAMLLVFLALQFLPRLLGPPGPPRD